MCNNFNKKFLDEAAKAMDENDFDLVPNYRSFIKKTVDTTIKKKDKKY